MDAHLESTFRGCDIRNIDRFINYQLNDTKVGKDELSNHGY